MNIQDSGSGYKQLQAGGGAGTGSDLGFQTSTNTRIEDGVSLLDALEDLGFVQSSSACGALGVTLVACTGIGALYALSKMQLIQEGSMGLTLHNGQPVILRPGRYVLLSPLHSFVEQKSINDDLIEFGPITVVTIKKVAPPTFIKKVIYILLIYS